MTYHPTNYTNPYRLVAIGGGGGVSQLMLGAAPYFAQRTALIAVTDTGRSTGTARAIGDLPAPGDLRNTLAALAAEPTGFWARLVQHRLIAPDVPALDGMAFGNLFIAALTQLEGDFAQAVQKLSELLACSATVLPIANVSAHICAELEDGTYVERELEVRGLHKAPIKRLWLSPPDAAASSAALAAIVQADLVVLGPGSFYTSLQACLSFGGVVEALRQTRAKLAFICNSTTQPGQTDGMGAYAHVQRLVALLGPNVLSYALISRGDQIAPEVREAYAAKGLHLIEPDDAELERISALGVTPIVRPLLESNDGPRQLWNKLDTIRSDPAALGHALWACVLPKDTESGR
ncbi:MAG: YvcK family protein [Candidatus Viridilinea halotolerans]|uniref:YvcK family protein n=1 Tax=Candidatus Viridilinea halotolerans TaxID=2491704 RepID=A0A426TY76_9CHLR|nr:MAG: YvcK family protein [Candidatus Viridilinea halotolerans]